MDEEISETAECGIDLTIVSQREDAGRRWLEFAAFSCLLMAMVMAVGALLAGMTANEALISRQKQIAELSEANFLLLEHKIVENRVFYMKIEDMGIAPDMKQEMEEWKRRGEKLTEHAKVDVEESEAVFHIHEILVIGVTILSLAISLTGLATLVKRPKIWYISLVVAIVGVVFVANGVVEFITIELNHIPLDSGYMSQP